MKLTIANWRNQPQEYWARWFAWHPVFAETADDCPSGHMRLMMIWLEDVERKEYISYCGWTWRYREIA